MLLKTAILTLFACGFGLAQITGDAGAPLYAAESIVNAATETVVALAPNTIGAVYGKNLAYSTRTLAASDVAGGLMPTVLDGVAVWINAIPCGLFYISPGQINFLVPYELVAGPATLIVARQGVAGSSVKIQLSSASPGMFLIDGRNALAGHLDGTALSAAAPAVPGETIVVYATGLGRTTPDTTSGRLATSAARLYYASQFQLLLDGQPVSSGAVIYAGLSPGFAGLYQINLKLPDGQTANPEVRIAMGDAVSPTGVYLAVGPANPAN